MVQEHPAHTCSSAAASPSLRAQPCIGGAAAEPRPGALSSPHLCQLLTDPQHSAVILGMKAPSTALPRPNMVTHTLKETFKLAAN